MPPDRQQVARDDTESISIGWQYGPSPAPEMIVLRARRWEAGPWFGRPNSRPSVPAAGTLVLRTSTRRAVREGLEKRQVTTMLCRFSAAELNPFLRCCLQALLPRLQQQSPSILLPALIYYQSKQSGGHLHCPSRLHLRVPLLDWTVGQVNVSEIELRASPPIP